jgi:hypothetical protein
VLALYLKVRLSRSEVRMLAEYYRADESPELGRGLDLFTTAFDFAVLSPILGIPAIAVSIGLICSEYGFEKLIEPDQTPDVNS